MKKSLVKVLVFAMLLGVFGITGAQPEAASKTKKVKVVTLKVGATKKLKVKAKGKVTWKSANTAIATVSKKGLVTGKRVGTTLITAKTKKKKYKYVVNVKESATTDPDDPDDPTPSNPTPMPTDPTPSTPTPTPMTPTDPTPTPSTPSNPTPTTPTPSNPTTGNQRAVLRDYIIANGVPDSAGNPELSIETDEYNLYMTYSEQKDEIQFAYSTVISMEPGYGGVCGGINFVVSGDCNLDTLVVIYDDSYEKKSENYIVVENLTVGQVGSDNSFSFKNSDGTDAMDELSEIGNLAINILYKKIATELDTGKWSDIGVTMSGLGFAS